MEYNELERRTLFQPGLNNYITLDKLFVLDRR